MSLYPKAIEAVLADVPRSKESKVYFVDPVHGLDTNEGTRWEKPLLTLATAEDRCVANHHDVVLYCAGTSGLTLSAKLTWDKSYTHLIGLCAPTMVGQRARIFCLAGDNGISPLIDITATGCVFKNLYIFHGVADAHALIDVQVTGGRNYFKNVHFAGCGATENAIDGGASLLINGGSENTFEDCTIGVDTMATATGTAGLVFAATGEAARNIFRRCHFTLWAGHANTFFVEALGNSGIDRYTLFEDCLFINLSGTAMTKAFNIAAGFDPANKRFLLKDCALIGATDWDAGGLGLLYLNMGTITGGGNAGLFAVQNAT